jgi:hypothetical protein
MDPYPEHDLSMNIVDIANPTITSCKASAVNIWRVCRIKIIFIRCKNALAYYNAGVVCCRIKSRGIGFRKSDVDFFLKLDFFYQPGTTNVMAIFHVFLRSATATKGCWSLTSKS